MTAMQPALSGLQTETCFPTLSHWLRMSCYHSLFAVLKSSRLLFSKMEHKHAQTQCKRGSSWCKAPHGASIFGATRSQIKVGKHTQTQIRVLCHKKNNYANPIAHKHGKNMSLCKTSGPAMLRIETTLCKPNARQCASSNHNNAQTTTRRREGQHTATAQCEQCNVQV